MQRHRLRHSDNNKKKQNYLSVLNKFPSLSESLRPRLFVGVDAFPSDLGAGL